MSLFGFCECSGSANMLTMYTGTEHLPMAAMVLVWSVSWLGCAVDTRCGSVVFTRDLLGAAHRELTVAMRIRVLRSS